MILFILSFFLVFASSYLLTSIIAPKKSILGLIYLFLIVFAQLVLTFEVLSLFTAIKEGWVLGANVFVLLAAGHVWDRKSRPLWSLDCKTFKSRVANSLKLDKSLVWLCAAFCVFIIVSLILCLLMPITSADAQGYHVARSLFWVLQGSLKHFETSDIRNLCLPINSEIIYAWIILFVKKDVFLGFPSFVGYILSVVSIYNMLGYLGYCTRRKLWVIFILSSFSSVLVQASSTETDIIIAGLVSSSIFLFWYALKNNKMTPIFMSALAYALALGAKTPSIIAIPGVGLFLLALCVHFKKYKPLAWFLGFGLINFLIFSSYNYILNFIQFSNFMGSKSFMVVSKNYYGIKGAFANFIKYIFMSVDFTGFKWPKYVGPAIENCRQLILSFCGLGYVKDGLYSTRYVVNQMLLEPIMGAGVLGFLVYVPCLVWSLIKPIFKFNSKKVRFIFAFALLFIINIFVISYLLVYMSFSVRFVMFFMVLSSPILVYSYLGGKNPLKYVIVAFSLFYLLCVSTHLWGRPFIKISKILMVNPSITLLRERAVCKDYETNPDNSNSACILKDRIKSKYSKENRILAFLNSGDSIYLLKTLEFEGYSIDFRRMEDVKNIDFDRYNLLIAPNKGQFSTYIQDYEKRKGEFVGMEGKKIILKKDNPVPCFYKKNRNLSGLKSEESSYPYQVLCGMSGDFLIQKHLEVIDLAGVINPYFNNYGYYVIYRNTKLPLILNAGAKNN
ncbi:MAG: hypothetical protein WCY19_07185 [Candidatus Gastranaerophilaceae bacterium]